MSEFDDQIRAYYNEAHIEDPHCTAILDAGRQYAQASKLKRWSYGLAAALLIMTGFAFWNSQKSEHDSVDTIVQVVASSHQKNLAPDIATHDYLELQRQLSNASFSVIPPTRQLREDYRLVGGRYCSLGTCFAIQLRLQDKSTGELLTLYVAKLDSTLRKASQEIRTLEGVQVKVWKDNSRLFALARYQDYKKSTEERKATKSISI